MAKRQTSRGRKQHRARVAGEQDYEARYAAKKTRKIKSRREESGEEGGKQPQARRTRAAAVTGDLVRRDVYLETLWRSRRVAEARSPADLSAPRSGSGVDLSRAQSMA
jgi:hypothetical protein